MLVSKSGKDGFLYVCVKTFRPLIFLALILLSLSACEKVFDPKLEASPALFVIEGSVTNLTGVPVEVRVSKTRRFDETTSFDGQTGAVVTIQVDNDSLFTLTESSPGIYTSQAFFGIPGKTYRLSVRLGGTTFTATSVMPAQLVRLDTLTNENFAFGGSSTPLVQPAYQDPPGLGNSYRFIQFVNGHQLPRAFVQNDELSDGLRITRPLVDEDGDLQSGDVVRVDMLHIDPAVYRYWYSLSESSTGNSQSASPGNPVSNLSGGALGCFSAHSVSSKTIVVP